MSAPVRLAVLGDPLAYTLSPELHRAGLAAAGREGDSRALRTSVDALGARLAQLANEGCRGVNLTHPLKEPALAHVATASDEARRARSVNTITFEVGGWRGDTTDGAGFVDLLVALGRPAAEARVLVLGAGGAARSLGLALVAAGAAVTVAARDPRRAREGWRDLEVAWTSLPSAPAAVEATDVVVNATPRDDVAGPLDVAAIPRGACVIDLVYGPTVTPWVRAARERGLDAWDGLGLLVHQARRSLSLWLGCDLPLAPLATAVGWPR